MNGTIILHCQYHVFDGMATQGARESAALLPTDFSGNILVSTPELANFVFGFLLSISKKQCSCTGSYLDRINVYCDAIMGAMASQIDSLTILYSTVYSGANQRKHQRSASQAFVRAIHRWPVNSPHKWPVTRKTFPLDDVIMPYRKDIRVDFDQISDTFVSDPCLIEVYPTDLLSRKVQCNITRASSFSFIYFDLIIAGTKKWCSTYN